MMNLVELVAFAICSHGLPRAEQCAQACVCCREQADAVLRVIDEYDAEIKRLGNVKTDSNQAVSWVW